LARLGEGLVQIRWTQIGFMPRFGRGQTPRNVMGFKDGTNNPSVHDPAAMDRYVWVGDEAPAWLQGGSYLVARRIRVALEHWDRTNLAFQEQTVDGTRVPARPWRPDFGESAAGSECARQGRQLSDRTDSLCGWQRLRTMLAHKFFAALFPTRRA